MGSRKISTRSSPLVDENNNNNNNNGGNNDNIVDNSNSGSNNNEKDQNNNNNSNNNNRSMTQAMLTSQVEAEKQEAEKHVEVQMVSRESNTYQNRLFDFIEHYSNKFPTICISRISIM